MSRTSKIANHARTYNSVMHIPNEEWAARVLGMQVNPEDGPDLVDKRKVVEVKFCLMAPIHRTPSKKWTVDNDQLAYPKQHDKIGFWGVCLYWLRAPVRNIHTRDHDKLELMVEKREIYLAPWNWMKQFPVHHVHGKTKFSEWDDNLRYPTFDALPPVRDTYEVDGGRVFLTRGVDKRYFKFLEQSVPF